jgi:NAD(P)-dependent dehydrogenase (short-subunit alcohol dehydrogenase family)
MRVDGKVVLIAGGSGALGGTVVPAFLAAGARAVTADRSPSTDHADGAPGPAGRCHGRSRCPPTRG